MSLIPGGKQLKLLALLIFLTLSCPYGAMAARASNSDCVKALGGIDPREIKTTWYTAVELGYHDKLIGGSPLSNFRQILAIDSADKSMSPGAMYLHNDAPDDSGVYFAEITESGFLKGLRMDFFGIHNQKDVRDKVDQNFELTWKTFREEETVPEAEIEQFKQHESELDPRRKVTFSSRTKDGKQVGVIRVFDGSPFPALYVGNAPTFTEAPQTDNRLPIEKRYPELDFREDSPYIFEIGRHAIAPGMPGMWQEQIVRISYYFWNKFGSPDSAPPIYRDRGRVYVEITSKHLKSYMGNYDGLALGFTLFAQSRNGGPMMRVKDGVSYEDLKIDRHSTEDKFILYKTVYDYVSHFGGGPLSEGRFKRQPSY